MAGLYDIGSSGIQAYRKALSVTGQNIANLNTEGYRRREASMEEISATQGGILSVSDQVGLGVRVSDISRAFDGFIAARARDSQSDFSRADTYKDALNTLESVLLPEDYDLTFSINTFFNGISSIAQAPGDLAGRVVALEQGKALASAFAALAGSLDALQTSIKSGIESAISSLNIETQGLANIQATLISAGGSGNAANSLLDQRDKSISSIAEFVGLSADYQTRGDATLSLGSTGSGPILVESKNAAALSASFEEGKVNIYASGGGSLRPTKQITSGIIAGLVAAYEAIGQTTRDLDGLARTVMGDLNTVHRSGLTLDGLRGGDMFSLDAIDVHQSTSNLGSIATSISAPAGVVSDATLTLTYDKANNIWNAAKPDGTIVASGTSSVEFQGVTLAISGAAADGDEISLSMSQGKAANMKFLLSKAEEFAAAGAIVSSESLENSGSASISVGSFSIPEPSGLTELTQLLKNDSGSVAATRLRNDGVIGVIPAGVSNIDLFSLKTQDSLSFSLSDAQQNNLSSLTVTLGGVDYEFDASAFNTRRIEDLATNMSQFAEMLNNGTLVTADQKNFADLGLFASGNSGLLSIASGGDAMTSGSILAGEAISGGLSIGNATASQIQVFTREGRQIAGVPLTTSEVINYLTPANGFLDQAEYSAQYLNGGADNNFQGSSIQRSSPSGAQTLRFSTSGFAPPVWSGDSFPITVPTQAQTISLSIGAEGGVDFEVPQGVMANYIAQEMNALSADLGVKAQAQTRLRLSAVPDGQINFSLKAENSEPIDFVGTVSNSDLRDLAVVINARSSETGITAHVSADFSQLTLNNADGYDIIVGDVATAGSGVELRPIGQAGQPRTTAPVTLGAAGSTTKFARFGGEITLTVPKTFSLTTDFGVKNSAEDPFSDGSIRREIDPGGSWMALDFAASEGLDGNEARPDGSLASAAAAKFSIALETDGSDSKINAAVHTATLTDLSSQSIAAALAKQIRSVAPIPVLKGVALTQKPSEGDSITLRLGQQDFVLRMTDGEIYITGPEAGRLSANFNENLELTVSAHDGSEMGAFLQVAENTSAAARAVFGLSETTRSQVLTGRIFSANALSSPQSLTFQAGEVSYSLQVALDSNAGLAITPDPALPAGTTVTWDEPTPGNYQLKLTRTGASLADDFRILPSANATALGLSVTPNQLTVDENGLRISTTDQSAIGIEAAAESLVSEHISLRNLPSEELIVILTGGGTRRLSAQFDREDVPAPVGLPRSLDVVVTDAASGRIEIIDHLSGDTIASRYLDETGMFNVAGVDLVLKGTLMDGDSFSVAGNVNGQGDGRNISQLLALQSTDQNSGRGGFSEKFSALILDVGAKVRSSAIAAASTEAVRDAAMEIESEFSGVNLDTEAARLLEQQQAYQALARVLSTAKELLDTLLRSI